MQQPDRIYTRYNFSAAAQIVAGSGAEMPSRVTNISFGGCRLLANHLLKVGAEVTIKIRTQDQEFEAPATVVRSTGNDVGLMFHNVQPNFLFVLEKWIRVSEPDKMRNQRRSLRSSFVVTAEVTDENSRTVIARLRNLNLYGCYIEMASPLTERTPITIKVSAGKTVFQARGVVIYSDPNAGSGVEFQGIEPRSQAVLEEWLLEARDVNKFDEV